MSDPIPTRTYFLGILTALAIGAALYFMRPVVLPLVVAAFFGILVRPVHVALKRFLPAGLSLALVTILVGLVLIAIPVAFAANIQAIAAKVPDYAPRIEEIVGGLKELAARIDLDLDFGSQAVLDSALGLLTASVEGAATFFGMVVLVMFTVAFVLSEADIFRAKLAAAMNPANKMKVVRSVASIRALLTQYVMTKSLICFLAGLTCGLFTWIVGIDFPFVWGVLTFMLYYIPNLGSIIAVIPPVLLALIQFDTPTVAIVTAIFLVVVFNVLGNVLEPRMLGRKLSLSPLVVFCSLLFWGWYLGIVGVVLAVPLTVACKIICEHIDALKPVAILMGDPHFYRNKAINGGPPGPLLPPDPPPPVAAEPPTAAANAAEAPPEGR